MINDFKMIKKHTKYHSTNFSPKKVACRLLDNDIDRPAEFPDNTFEACSLPRILKLMG